MALVCTEVSWWICKDIWRHMRAAQSGRENTYTRRCDRMFTGESSQPCGRTWERRTLPLLKFVIWAGKLRKLGPRGHGYLQGWKVLSVGSERALWNTPLFLGPPQVIVPCVRVTRKGTHYQSTGLQLSPRGRHGFANLIQRGWLRWWHFWLFLLTLRAHVPDISES